MATAEQDDDDAITPLPALPTVHQGGPDAEEEEETDPPGRASLDTNVSPTSTAPAAARRRRPPPPEPTGTRAVRGYRTLRGGGWRHVDWRALRLSDLWERHEVQVFREPDWDGTRARRRARKERWRKALKKGTCRGEEEEGEEQAGDGQEQSRPVATEEVGGEGDGGQEGASNLSYAPSRTSGYAETTEVNDAFGAGRYEIGPDGVLRRKPNLAASIRRKFTSGVKALKRKKKAAAAPVATTGPGAS
ncbi:hypothetical protein NpPPO83_00000590 [Neofusicoccum parvum]|uniref:Uncharacterized protein n=1 Tax=Neofusicoccum parvum TaxID=310453 RepID=A0ACB5RXQ0_9PEZI|nr:hypothetical protein NpPPO83_00000590 [Neofusicoccum parvum]